MEQDEGKPAADGAAEAADGGALTETIRTQKYYKYTHFTSKLCAIPHNKLSRVERRLECPTRGSKT